MAEQFSYTPECIIWYYTHTMYADKLTHIAAGYASARS